MNNLDKELDEALEKLVEDCYGTKYYDAAEGLMHPALKETAHSIKNTIADYLEGELPAEKSLGDGLAKLNKSDFSIVLSMRRGFNECRSQTKKLIDKLRRKRWRKLTTQSREIWIPIYSSATVARIATLK